MGAKITTNELLDKSQLKKILTKKGEAMKRKDTNRSLDMDVSAMVKKSKVKSKPSNRRITLKVDDDFNRKLQQLEINMETVKQSNPMKSPRSPKSSRSPRSPGSSKPGGYAEMMAEINDRLQTVGFAKRNMQIEERLNRFFPSQKMSAECRIIHDTMQQIGQFQINENRLDHIKNFRKVQEQSEKVKQLKEEKARSSRHLTIPTRLNSPEL